MAASKLFGDNTKTHDLAEFLLELFSLEELLEKNDLTEHDVLVKLLEDGFISEPRSVIQGYEEDEAESD